MVPAIDRVAGSFDGAPDAAHDVIEGVQMRYSGLAVLAQGLTGNKGCGRRGATRRPKDAYDIVIIVAAAMVLPRHSTSPRSMG